MKRPGRVTRVTYATSPLLASKTPPWRSKLLVLLLGAAFGVLLVRAFYVQIINASFYLRQGEARYAKTLDLPASRGRITDRNGVILAASIPVPSLCVIPKDFDASPQQRRQLAKLLGYSVPELEARIGDNVNFAWLRRQVDEQVAQRVKALKLKGVHELREYKRKYPEGEAAAHVVGFTNIEDRGQEGVELAFQQDLAGHDGIRQVIRDRLGSVVEEIGEVVAAADGHDVELSIDSKVQFFAYQRLREAVAEHEAKAGSVVVLDVQTGEVLALVNFPSYQPSDRRNLRGSRLRNLALTDTFEPASTIKPFIVGLSLETGRVTPNTVIQTTPGYLTVGGATIRDGKSHGALTVAEVIQKSSNVGIVKLAMQMQPHEMWELFSALGFGQRPAIAFPGAVSGRLRPAHSWRPIEQATMSYGYGLSVSLFQLARAYTVLARDGELIPSSLLKRARSSRQGNAGETAPAGVRVLTPGTAQAVRAMLRMATLEGGTAPLAQTVGYSVGGKTGTAYKQDGKVYSAKKFRSWFVGMAPIQRPRIVVAVMVDEPSKGKHYGGDVAAPVFSVVVQQTLRMMGVQPDLDVRPQVVSRATSAEQESL